MAPHDPLFKSLLRTFFAGFLRLVVPKTAERLDLSAPVFLDKEFSTAGPPAQARVVDLLVQVPLKKNGNALLVHIEVETRARRGIGERLRSYHRWIRIRHEGQILSIVLFLHGGKAGLRELTLQDELVGPGLTKFRYLTFGIDRCSAADYLTKPEPLAWALAALMDRGTWSRVELMMRCLSRIADARLSETESCELVNCVETYLQLSPAERGELSFLSSSEVRRVHSMLYRLTWAEKNVLEGEGRGARQVLLGVLEERFGPLADDVRDRIEKIRSVERLTRLAQRAVTAKSLKSLRLG
jgi:hypothetical protein